MSELGYAYKLYSSQVADIFFTFIISKLSKLVCVYMPYEMCESLKLSWNVDLHAYFEMGTLWVGETINRLVCLVDAFLSEAMAGQVRTMGFFAPCAYGFGVDATVFLENGKRFGWVKRTYTRIILREYADGLARSSVSNVIC